MNTLDYRLPSDAYFERLASELEILAEAIHELREEDRELALRLKAFAEQIRADSGLPSAGSALQDAV